MLDGEANRELFEEQVEIILKAFNEESFAYQGKYYTLPPAVPYRGYQLQNLTLVPRPLHRPVEVWQPMVSGNPRGIDFMVRHGIHGVISPTLCSIWTSGCTCIATPQRAMARICNWGSAWR
jgi:alkanesulfonate monooxygenase SsuD/methylene tetrahydromethanopterin reductase-like flavin-dependent oxidoreductase (luciferase family)